MCISTPASSAGRFRPPFKTSFRSHQAAPRCRAVHMRLHFKEATMAQGTVKWFNPEKGFGFIQHAGGGKDVFVHISAVERAGLSALTEGQSVTFDIMNERGKDAATNLKL